MSSSSHSIPASLCPTSSTVQFHGSVFSQNSGSPSSGTLPSCNRGSLRVFHRLTLETLPEDMIGRILGFEPNVFLKFLQTSKCLNQKVIVLLTSPAPVRELSVGVLRQHPLYAPFLLSGEKELKKALHLKLAWLVGNFTEMKRSSFREEVVNSALHHWDQAILQMRKEDHCDPAQVKFTIHLFRDPSDNTVEVDFQISARPIHGTRRMFKATRTDLVVRVGRPPKLPHECMRQQPHAQQIGEKDKQRHCTLQ